MKRLSEARQTVDRMIPGDEDESQPPELGGFVEWLQQPGVRAHLKRVFSRKMLGSVILAATTTRIIETSFAVIFGVMSPIRVLGWIVTWFAAILVFVSWDYIVAASAEKAEQAADKAEKVTDKAEKTATKKSPRTAARPAKKAEETADKVEKILDDAEKKAKKKAKKKAEKKEKAKKTDRGSKKGTKLPGQRSKEQSESPRKEGTASENAEPTESGTGDESDAAP